MPRKPRNESPLRRLRAVTGLNQSDFADLCRINPGTYQNIELGRQVLSWDMAHRVKAATGIKVVPDDEMEPRIELKTRSGKPYTTESFRTWREWIEAPHDIGGFLKKLDDAILLIIDAAKQDKVAGHVLQSLVHSLKDVVDEHDLSHALGKVLARNAPADPFIDDEFADRMLFWQRLESAAVPPNF